MIHEHTHEAAGRHGRRLHHGPSDARRPEPDERRAALMHALSREAPGVRRMRGLSRDGEIRRGGRGGHGDHGGRPRPHGLRLQARRGAIREAILGLLAEQPMHGYQVMQELAERSGGRWHPSAGSVYPTLQQLQDEGLVVAEDRDGRRTFALTDAGRAAATAVPEERPWRTARPATISAGSLASLASPRCRWPVSVRRPRSTRPAGSSRTPGAACTGCSPRMGPPPNSRSWRRVPFPSWRRPRRSRSGTPPSPRRPTVGAGGGLSFWPSRPTSSSSSRTASGTRTTSGAKVRPSRRTPRRWSGSSSPRSRSDSSSRRRPSPSSGISPDGRRSRSGRLPWRAPSGCSGSWWPSGSTTRSSLPGSSRRPGPRDSMPSGSWWHRPSRNPPSSWPSWSWRPSPAPVRRPAGDRGRPGRRNRGDPRGDRRLHPDAVRRWRRRGVRHVHRGPVRPVRPWAPCDHRGPDRRGARVCPGEPAGTSPDRRPPARVRRGRRDPRGVEPMGIAADLRPGHGDLAGAGLRRCGALHASRDLVRVVGRDGGPGGAGRPCDRHRLAPDSTALAGDRNQPPGRGPTGRGPTGQRLVI